MPRRLSASAQAESREPRAEGPHLCLDGLACLLELLLTRFLLGGLSVRAFLLRGLLRFLSKKPLLPPGGIEISLQSICNHSHILSREAAATAWWPKLTAILHKLQLQSISCRRPQTRSKQSVLCLPAATIDR